MDLKADGAVHVKTVFVNNINVHTFGTILIKKLKL